MFDAVVLPTKVSIALSGRAAREKKEKVFLIFLLLLVACCGKIAANYGATVSRDAQARQRRNIKKGNVTAPLTLF
jgi:hypothetical protein